MDITKDKMQGLLESAWQAGRAIMEVYQSGNAEVTIKDDLSPLTLADRRSHAILMERIGELFPDIPIISEEGASVPFVQRQGWQRFFLIDPLDGTKEFIKRNGEFTVNIGYIEEGLPRMGVIHIPAKDETYYATEGSGAFYMKGQVASPERISVLPSEAVKGLVVVASRSHGSETLEALLSKLDVRERTPAGSALKFTLVAHGLADLYPRLGPTWEWDTAAGHAIVREAGGAVLDSQTLKELRYNNPSLKHVGFIACADPVGHEALLRHALGA